MKKFLAILLAAVMITATFAACGKKIDDSSDQSDQSQPLTSGDSSVTDVVPGGQDPVQQTGWDGDTSFVTDNGIGYIWNQLEGDVRENVATIMTAIKNVELVCTLPHGLDITETTSFATFIYNLCMDYPYVGTEFTITDMDGDGLRETVVIPYRYDVISTQEEAWGLTAQLEDRISEIVSGMPAGGTDYEKIKYLHDELIFSTDYSQDSKMPFTAYGALVEHKATCQGYSDAMHMLLTRAGYESVFVVGHGNSYDVTHKWDYVKVSDGNWYVIDPTWADPEGRNDKYYINYDYLFISDEVLLQDHLEKTVSPYYTAPEATSMDLNFHVMEGYYVTSYEEARECVKEQVLECAKEGRRYVYLRVSDEAAYDEIYKKLLVLDEGGEIYDFIKEAKEQTGADLTGSWQTYRGHKDGRGPLCLTVTIKYEGD